MRLRTIRGAARQAIRHVRAGFQAILPENQADFAMYA
jgi:hypothetical protein